MITAEIDGVTHVEPQCLAWHMPSNWWTKKRNYRLFMVREVSAVFLAIFLLGYLGRLAALADGEAAYFLAANRNKRSITVDLGSPDGQQVLRDLAGHADVLIENFRVGTMARHGLAAADLCRANPRLICCSITAYGQQGSRAQEPGYDAMIQARAGLMSITGPPEPDGGGPPQHLQLHAKG